MFVDLSWGSHEQFLFSLPGALLRVSPFGDLIVVVCVQAADGDVDAVLDRDPPQRSSTVAGPRADADGLARPALLLHVLNALHTTQYTLHATHHEHHATRYMLHATDWTSGLP